MRVKKQFNKISKQDEELTYVPIEEGCPEEVLRIVLAQLRLSVDQLAQIISKPSVGGNFDDF